MSFNDCFVRVIPVTKPEEGAKAPAATPAKDRGDCWTLHPDCGEMFQVSSSGQILTAVRQKSPLLVANAPWNEFDGRV